jgi:sarcosine oxidase, subunit beta
VARIVIAGAGAIGASIAYHLALRGARGVVLCDLAGVASGSTGKAMGGVRQQFSTEAEVRLAQASIRFFERLGPPLFEQVGYLFVATSDEGLARLEERRALQHELGVPVERVDASRVPGLGVDDVLGATLCREDGVADPPAVTRHLVAEGTARGVELRERTDALEVDADVLVVACGPRSVEVAAARGVDLPVRPLCRQLLETARIDKLPADLPMTIEEETGFHFRRRGDRLVLAMVDPELRWGFEERVDEELIPDRLERLAHRYPPAAGTTIEHAWAGLYDMTPDAHPIIGWVDDGIYAACGFSGHGFMQSPAVGEAAAAELIGEEPPFDLSPYRLARFAEDVVFPETLVL